MIKCDSQIKEDEKVYAIISFFEKTSSKRRDMIISSEWRASQLCVLNTNSIKIHAFKNAV